jgi:arylsulfatase A-like enzyme
MKRTLWLLAALVLGSAALCPDAGGQAPAPRPNIVFVLADDLGWSDVGYHGKQIRTPNIDRLAAGGAKLEQFYVQPVCSPTRAALMTGRYPMRLGLQVGVIRPYADYGLPLEERTLPQALRNAGYYTAICGKWHLGLHRPEYLPTARGFDHQYGHYCGAIDYFTHHRDGGLDWHRNDKALEEQGYSTNLIADEAVRIIRSHDGGKPLFLYVPFNAVHSPLQAPEEYLQRYEHIRDKKRRTYAAMTTCMDAGIGRIVQALRDRGMRDKTLIVFSSDNGGPINLGATNGHLRAGKGTLYEGGVRVAAFAHWPGVLEPETIVQHPLHMVDWYPTLLKLAGASLEQALPIDGQDAWPTLVQGQPLPRAEILHNITPSSGAIRVANWKLVVRSPGDSGVGEGGGPAAKEPKQVELFDLLADPSEKQNLAEEQPAKVRELRARLEAYASMAVPPRNKPQAKDFRVPKVWGEATSDAR